MSFPSPSFTRKSAESERGVLSCLRTDLAKSGAVMLRNKITPKFFLEPNAFLFAGMMEIFKNHRQFDIIALSDWLRNNGHMERWLDLEAVRGALYESVSIALLPKYLQGLMECHCSRALYALGLRLMLEADDAPSALAATRLVADSAQLQPTVAKTSLSEHLDTAMHDIGRVVSGKGTVDFGLGLDQFAGPFCRSDLVLLAGDTKRGKSAMAGNIVENVASRGGRCLVFSLEMSGPQSALRMLASQARVDIRSMMLRKRRIDPGMETQQDRSESFLIQKALPILSKWKVDIIDDADSIERITGDIIGHEDQLDLVVVDYAQLCGGIRNKGDNREREVASISRGLKRAASQAGCVILLLSQLNEDGKLRESRALGQDANCILAIEGDGEEMTVRILAARSAPGGAEHKLRWQPSFTRFSYDG